jgi:hypothetical protein
MSSASKIATAEHRSGHWVRTPPAVRTRLVTGDRTLTSYVTDTAQNGWGPLAGEQKLQT